MARARRGPIGDEAIQAQTVGGPRGTLGYLPDKRRRGVVLTSVHRG